MEARTFRNLRILAYVSIILMTITQLGAGVMFFMDGCYIVASIMLVACAYFLYSGWDLIRTINRHEVVMKTYLGRLEDGRRCGDE